jgi:hypothetical protein
MKQLLLYFLFFVCAAFVLVQCARYFPTDTKTAGGHSPVTKPNQQVQNESSNTRPSNSTYIGRIQSAFNKPAFNLYFNEQAFPLNMVKYINHYQFLSYQYWSINENKVDTWQLFYNPYTSFTYTGLFNKSDSSLIANNPFDRVK